MIDIQRLTLGEVSKIEELSGQSIGSIGDESAPKGKTLAALAFVAKKREEPKFTWNDALGLSLDEATAIIGLDEGEDAPLEPAPEPTPSKPTRTKK